MGGTVTKHTQVWAKLYLEEDPVPLQETRVTGWLIC